MSVEGVLIELSPAGRLVMPTPDMPELEKHQVFSAFVSNPWGLSLMRTLNSLEAPTSIPDIAEQTKALGIDVERWVKRFHPFDAEPAPRPFGVVQIGSSIDFLARGLGLVEIQDNRMVQLTIVGRAYVKSQLALIDASPMV